MRRMTLPETHMRPVESANAASKSRPVASTKSPKKCMMRYDQSSVTLAMQTERHGASVAQVPADATMSRQSPTNIAQSHHPLVAASKSIQAAHLPPVSPKKAAAGSVSTVPSGQPQLASALQRPVNCRAERGRSYSMCMLGRGSSPTDWLGARTWDLDLPPLIRPRRRRWTRSSCEIRRSTPRSRHLNFPNFCG